MPEHRVPFVVVGFDRQLSVTAWNELAEQRFGRPAADALGRDVAGLLPLAGGASWRDLLQDRDGAAPVWLTFADGRTWEWTPAPARTGGEVDGVVCYGADVTARAAAREHHALEHVMLSTLYSELPVVVCAYDSGGNYIFIEGQALGSVGLSREKMLGQNPAKMFGDNTSIAEFIRRGLAGESTRMTLESFGRSWDSWHIPAPPGSRAAMVSMSLDVTEQRLREQELAAKLDLIERQQQMIRELSTPIIEVWEGVLVMPIIGLVDSVRTAEIMNSLLQSVGHMRAKHAILDMTGIDVVDTATADHLLRLIRAVRLLGAEGILTGINPGIAQTVVTLGVDLTGIPVYANLRQALKHCLAR